MTSDRKHLVRVSIAGALTVAGAFIAVYYALVLGAFLSGRSLAVANPLGLGFVLFLIGVFNLLFSGPTWASFPRRLLSFLPSSKLLGTLFLFLLPWVNVQCHQNGSVLNDMMAAQTKGGSFADNYAAYQEKGSPVNDLVAYQTGLQVASGGYTNGPVTNPLRPEGQLKSPPQPAPLVIAAGLMVLAGVAGGLLLRRRLSRCAVLPACSLVVFLLLLMQSQSGLPINAIVAAENRTLLKDPHFARLGFSQPLPQLVLEHTWWCYAAMALPLAAVVSAGADWLVHRRKPAIQFQETVVLVGLAALGSLTLIIAMHGSSNRPVSSRSDAQTQETGAGEKTAVTRPTVAVGGKVPALPREIAVDLGRGLKLEMVLIPAGEFLMGSPDTDRDARFWEKPQHRVRITKPFYLGKYLVTREKWDAVMEGRDFPGPLMAESPKHPVRTLWWESCGPFFENLNAKSAAGHDTFHFPTAAQWEYACRAGSTTRYCYGDDASHLGDYAWYRGNSHFLNAHPVGEKKPNAWGLYDMHGNVWEWCQDWYDGGYYAESPTDDPTGPATGKERMLRGGSSFADASDCRSASCYARSESGAPDGFGGLRVCLVPAEK